MSQETADALFQELDANNSGAVPIDALLNLTGGDDSILAMEFLNRFEMLEQLHLPVLVSNIRSPHILASYISRYTSQTIVIAVGGGNFSIKRGLFDPDKFANDEGGMLEAFGKLFASNTRIFTFPNISDEGQITPGSVPDGEELLLYNYFVGKGFIVPMGEDCMPTEARDKKYNQEFRYGSPEVQEMIRKGLHDWELYVPTRIAKVARQQKWFTRLAQGTDLPAEAFKFLNDL